MVLRKNVRLFCYILSKSRRQLKKEPAIALRSKRKVVEELETKQTNKNARPRTTTDARTGALGNGLDLKPLSRKKDSIRRMWIEERERINERKREIDISH